jgi:drug/metabolite transporter (DMT)-like permease
VFSVLTWEFAAAAMATGLAACIDAKRTGRPLRTSPRSVGIASIGQIVAGAAAIGVVPIALANSAWDIAIRIGERSRAGLLGYGVPVISTVRVVVLTELEADWTLAAAMLVTLGAALPEIMGRTTMR